MATTVIGDLNQYRRFKINNKLEREYQRGILVRSDTGVRGPLEASIAAGVDFGETYRTLNTTSGEYEYDSGAEAWDFEAVPYAPEDDHTLWVVIVKYSSNPPEPELFTAGGGGSINTAGGGGAAAEGGDGQNESPLAEPAKVTWGKQTRLVALAKALNSPPTPFFNNRFCTTANEPFNKVPEIDFGILALTITRNEATFNAPDRERYWETTNAWPFYGFLANAVLCTSITGTRDYRNKTTFWPVTYNFLIDSTGNAHRWRPINKGFLYCSAPNVLPDPLDSSTGVGRRKEVFLKEDGTRLADGDPPFVLDFTIYAESDFGPLNLE